MKMTHGGGDFYRPRLLGLLAGWGLLFLLSADRASADWHIKRVASMAHGITWTYGYVVPYKVRTDGFPSLVFSAGIPNSAAGVYFYRYQPVNRYVLVKVDTGNLHQGFYTGNMIPWATDDVNGDSEPELAAFNCDSRPTTFYLLAVLYGYSAWTRALDSVDWSGKYDSLVSYNSEPFYITDLDQDGRREVVFCHMSGGRIFIYENCGLDSMRLVCILSGSGGTSLAFGDFDQDGRMELVSGANYGDLPVSIFKCTGDDQYVLWDTVMVRRPNGTDMFSGANIDGTHRATCFGSFFDVTTGQTWLYLFEPSLDSGRYRAVPVESATFTTGEVNGRSVCGDIDGDGIDEILWSCGTQIQAYKCIGPHQFQLIWYWWNQGSNSCNLNIYDMNGNGYNEILMSGGDRTYIFEIEAIRVLYPNTRLTFHPGDTCRIRWQTYNPPRCDSVALLLRKDTTWQLDTIAHGLPPTDTAYTWVVPDIRSDSCRIVAIAYGPGWQYDESDSCFRIAPVGMAEAPAPIIRQTRLLGISPNPVRGHVEIRFQLAEPGRVTLRISNVLGRTVATLVDGVLKPGQYTRFWPTRALPSGIYFLDFIAGQTRTTAKLTVSH